MKTLTISEAVRDLANWLKRAIAGEDIAIQSDDAVVALRPLARNGLPRAEPLAPREALRLLQREARLTRVQVENYLREIYAERLAAEKRST
jgi:antitoxin (DNA-binding transcriptional repressor) of toxin-antitoxin stability system